MVIQNSEVYMASKSSIAREMKMSLQSETRPVINFTDINFLGGGQTTEKTKKQAAVDNSNPLLNAAANRQVRMRTMDYLIKMLLLGGYFDENTPLGKMMHETFGEEENQDFGFNSIGMTGAEPVFVQSTKISYQYSEEQSVEFSSTGTAITADGRKLSFNYSFAMSESFTEEYKMEHIAIRNCVDPLVINLDDCPTSIDDQTFYFDLDADGQEEELHNLKKGSGFLALDRNGDGQINDGMELFGARTGDGFGELSEFDEDGNGWIDENDSIFARLRIMTINEKGEKELYGLLESDVGAIFLGRVDTELLKRDDDHNINAAIRQSGIFLHEKDGHAGGVQHVDFAN